MTGTSPIPVSVVILSHNEAVNLPRCIAAVSACDDVVVLDDGSTDESQAVARQAGARVVEHPYTSFADQRNWAMAHAGIRHPWVLHLDADEVMTPSALDEVCQATETMSVNQVGCLARKVMLEDRWLRYCTDYPVHVPRLIHQDGPRFVMSGHGEIIDAPASARVLLSEPMLHYTWSKGWPDWWERHRRYARAEAERIACGDAQASLGDFFSSDRSLRRKAIRSFSYHIPGRSMLRFLYGYIGRGGWRDGKAGWLFCRAMARYERMIDEELRRTRCESR